MSKIYTVTKDVSANYKKLRVLERKGIIKIINIKVENNAGRWEAILPTATFVEMQGMVLDSMKLGFDQQAKILEKLKEIIDANNIKDCVQLEAHIRESYDYFVTEDTDILNVRTDLAKEFADLKIRTPDELIKELDK